MSTVAARWVCSMPPQRRKLGTASAGMFGDHDPSDDEAIQELRQSRLTLSGFSRKSGPSFSTPNGGFTDRWYGRIANKKTLHDAIRSRFYEPRGIH